MHHADQLNALLRQTHPAASRCLSPLGQRLFYPQGVTAQAAEARGCTLNATIGQFTADDGHAMPLPAMHSLMGDVPIDEVYLYAPQGGRGDLRSAWQEHLQLTSISLPLVTSGLTHGLSTCADLFADPDTDVLLPEPGWGNYDHIFGTRCGARLHRYPVIDPETNTLALDRFAEALAALPGKAVVVINFPSNPLGYTPTREQLAELAEVLLAAPGPLVVICDDAYQGMLWEDGLSDQGLFPLLLGADPERILAVKVDGATKELFFFGGRVGFVTFSATGQAAEVLEEKARAVVRATISSVSAPSQALVMAALRAPDLSAQQEEIRTILRHRYRVLKAAMAEEGLNPWPFNSAFFALLKVGDRAEQLRKTLLGEGVGVVAFPRFGALRLSYSTIPHTSLPQLARAIAGHVA